MATMCDNCGYRTNEVKPGGGIESQGVKIVVNVSSPEDLNRDILKVINCYKCLPIINMYLLLDYYYFQSETCSLSIPQLDFEVGALSLSGRFTTIEGLVTALYDQLKDTLTTFYAGDSQSEDVITKTNQFLDKLNKIKKCEMSVDIILTDPAGNSYIQVNNI